MTPASLREQARLNRGLLILAPVLWAAFSVFINPWWGCAGFSLHFFLCLPRRKAAWLGMLAPYPVLAVVFAAHDPALTLDTMPFHLDSRPRSASRFWIGEVANFPTPMTGGKGTAFLFANVEGLFRVSLSEETPPALGATVLLLATEEAPEPPANPGQRNPLLSLRAQGVNMSLKATAWKELRPPPTWKSLMARIRAALGQSLESHVPAAALPLVSAALLNDTRRISESTQQDFLRSGMQHILAISGQHIGLLVAFLLIPALCLRVPRKAAFAAAGVLTAIYVPLTGAPVSVARAGLMLAFFLPSIFLERPALGLNTFCLAAALDLLISPFHVLNLGFQLSYAATLALILCARPGRSIAQNCGHGIVGAIAQMLFLSVMVTLFTYPVLAASTHAFAPWSILGNLLTVPISSAMLIGGLCTLTSSPFPLLARWAGACTGMCSLLLESCLHFLSRLPGALWPIAEPASFWLVFLSGCALISAFLFQRKKWRLGVLTVSFVVVCEMFRPCLSVPFPGGVRVTFLSVGHGDAAVLEFPGATILIDDGPSPGIAQRILIPFLQSRGIRRLDAVLLTHPDMDHYGGTFALLERVPIGFIMAPPVRSKDAPWLCLKAETKRLGIPWKEGGIGDILYRQAGVSLRILGPDSTLDSASDNNHSLVCLLQTWSNRVLFTGDIEGPAQQALAGTWPLWRGAWLKAPHHGSDRTTLPCFLRAAYPPKVAISSGKRPGFPGLTTVALLKDLHADIGVTARDGSILWDFPPGETGGEQRRKFRAKF